MKKCGQFLALCSLVLLFSCETKQTTHSPKAIEAAEQSDGGIAVTRDEKEYLEWMMKSPSRTVFSFENDQDFFHFDVENGLLKQSDKIYQFGEKSLLWEWDANSKIVLQKIKSLSKKESTYVGQGSAVSPSFVTSVYNGHAINDKLTFSFLDKKEREVSFDLKLNFTGWRTIWVPFYEMKGSTLKQREVYEVKKCTIAGPQFASAGQLYFDDLIVNQFTDDRHQYQDSIVPFIKEGVAAKKDHWMPQLKLLKLYDDLDSTEINPSEQTELQALEKNLDNEIHQNTKFSSAQVVDQLKALGLEYNKTITGKPLKLSVQVYPIQYQKAHGVNKDYVDFERYSAWLLTTADSWKNSEAGTEKENLEQICVAGIQYLQEQGYQAGSSLGTLHHFGYQFRSYTKACFVLRSLLADHGFLKPTARAVAWFMNAGEILDDESRFFGNIDYYNTIAFYRLLAIMMCESESKKLALLKAFNAHLGKTLAFTDERGVFKIDGTAWHHHGHYPAYAVGAFASVGQIFKVMNGTSFKIESSGHANFKKALMASRIYTQKFDWGLGLAGRHPLNGSIEHLAPVFLSLALSGSPDASQDLDKEVAAAYVRLWGEPQNEAVNEIFQEHGIEAEKLSGTWSFPYADYLVHRRKNWMASIKGFSKNVWSSEIYTKDNRYGRYQSNGTLQIMSGGNKADGYVEAGWDWNRAPGATVIEYPHEKLEPQQDTSFMYRSTTSFSGGLQAGDHGLWAMILNSSQLDGRLKARKSIFAFGDRLLCLGSDIRSREDKYPTSTVLFQHYLKDAEKELSRLNSVGDIKGLNTEQSYDLGRSDWIQDSHDNLYVMLSDTKVKLRRKIQRSPMNKYSIRRDDLHASKSNGIKYGEGEFASAVIDHGEIKKGASYAYVLYPKINKNKIAEATKETQQDIHILRQDRSAHIVLDKKRQLMGIVAFEAIKLAKGLIQEIKTPCLITLKKNKKSFAVSLANPDVNDALNKARKRLEGHSLVSPVTFIMKGSWACATASEAISIRLLDDESTEVTVQCQSGLTYDFELLESSAMTQL